MALSTKELRRRIRVVTSLQKITRAMEMVATTKFRRLQERAQGSRPHADAIRRISARLAASGAPTDSPLLEARPRIEKAAILVLSSERGLCGSYNTNVFRKLAAHVQSMQGRQTPLYTLGRKARVYCHRRYEIREALLDEVERLKYRRAKEIAEQLTREFLKGSANGGVDEVWIVYTRFVSMGRQVATLEKLLPIERDVAGESAAAGGTAKSEDLLLEPTAGRLLDLLLPKSLSIRVFAAILDALASEFAARRMAMKAATDAAGDMIHRLRRSYNRARQETITKELLDIIGGAEALK